MAAQEPQLSAGGRAALVGSLRRVGARRTVIAERVQERCDICRVDIPLDHRHLLQLEERAIVCVCEPCWALRSGDPEYRPTGTRTLWLGDFVFPDELWTALAIPIGLAFLFRSSATGSVVALYPSPAGATESELDLHGWGELVALNPLLAELEVDAEALVVNRLADPPQYAIVPIDRCYLLVGMIRAGWEGISGGDAVEVAVRSFFDDLRRVAA
jgi:uncharacterized protein DUF5947